MRIAFLNLCHCEPDIVARVAKKLTADPDFDMYVHVDAKTDITPFSQRLNQMPQVYFTPERFAVYWGGYHAIEATYELLNTALASDRKYDYFVIMQNLDYPIKSNTQIKEFFVKNKGKEFIRACDIAHVKDWHYAKKYRLFYKKDSDFYLQNHSRLKKVLHNCLLGICSIRTILFNGVIKEKDRRYDIYYGCAQWAVTRELAKYFVEFKKNHSDFNKRMKMIQFPDEEYFHTIVHNSEFKYHCVKYNEPVKRWLVNWRNLHYFEFPFKVTVLEEKDYEKLVPLEELFCRKVRGGISDGLMDRLDQLTMEGIGEKHE